MKIDGLALNMTVSAPKDQSKANIPSSPPPYQAPSDGNVNAPAKEALNKEVTTALNNLNSSKAVFAVDEDKNVVIKFLDSDGKTIKQLPPEDYLQMVKALNLEERHLFQKKA